MLLTCVVLGVLACHDEPLAPARAQGPAPALASGPVTLAHASCTLTFTNSTGTIDCGTHGRHAPGVSAGATLYPFGPYVFVTPTHLVKDTVAQTWAFDATVQNLLGEPIGTLDGTTMLGVYSVITGLQVTSGSGTLSVANADGDSTFTAPNQPYFRYAQILAPQQTSAVKTWRFNVPNTAKAINIDFVIVADFPAEANVAATPPDSTPVWFKDDSSWGAGDTTVRVSYVKHIVGVVFKDGTSLQDRQLATAYVDGTVVGGEVVDGTEGVYYLHIPAAGSSAQLDTVIDKLMSLPQVDAASLYTDADWSYLRPHDGANWQTWKLDPDSAAGEQNWALEAIAAPYAWGCSTGDRSTQVGIIDHGFDRTEVTNNVVGGANLLGQDPAFASRHGALVSAIIGASGNDSVGMTGTMWRSGLVLADGLGASTHLRPGLPRVGFLIDSLSHSGIRIINLSLTAHWTYQPRDANQRDSLLALRRFRVSILPRLRAVLSRGERPLLVIAAGNINRSAYYSVLALAKDYVPTLVVGASTVARTRWLAPGDSGSDYGRMVDVYAPGDDVITEFLSGGTGPVLLGAVSGTSFAAAYVAGVAGLIASFDPSASTDSLRSYIVNGAAHGGRLIAEPSDTKPLLNAYESLKLAAQRPGAPLCGNRVWSVNGQVYAQRDSTTTEALFATGETAGELNVMHGGHRIHFLGQTALDDREFVFDGTQWSEASNPATLPPGVAGGTFNSLFQVSHDGDSAVFVQTGNGTITVTLQDNATRATRQLATWTIPLSQGSEGCVYTIQAPGDTLQCEQSAMISGVSEVASAGVAYSPRGDQVIVTVNVRATRVISVGSWHECRFSSPGGSGGLQCRVVQYETTSEDARVYAVDTRTGTVTALPGIPTTEVFWRAVGEPGTELVLGGGLDVVESSVVDDAVRVATVITSQMISNCRVEYRVLATGAVTRSIATNDACAFAGDGLGTISPRRVHAARTIRLRGHARGATSPSGAPSSSTAARAPLSQSARGASGRGSAGSMRISSE
ncbi:MAG: S8 family serine peptidase [Gemmatimonadaceae bacterium]|nr:S8 family serine peptidase [Gemmatimonadaceae bacterium]